MDLQGLNDSYIDADYIEGVMGAFNGLGAAQRRNVAKTLAARVNKRVVPTNNLTGKAEFEARLSSLPADVMAGLRNKSIQLIDYSIYTATIVGTAVSKELMASADTVAVGKTNINNRKLEAGRYFLLTGITLLSGVHANINETEFGVPANNILNGELDLKLGDKLIIRSLPCTVFNTTDRHDVPAGYMKLDNPKMIPAQTEIIPELKCPAGNVANTNVKIILHGVYTQGNK